MRPIKAILNSLENNYYVTKYGRQIIGSDFVNDSDLYAQVCMFLAKKYHLKRPYGSLRLNIETTLACNAKCVICTKRSYPLKIGTMSSDLYTKIIKEAKDIGVKKVVLSIFGEPLADPDFISRAALADQAGIQFSFYTNGSLLNEAKTNYLLGMENFHKIYFSVNGFSEEVYESVMVGLKRDCVFSNILRFLELKEKLRPDISVNINCVEFSKNFHEINKIRKYFRNRPGVDNVYFPVLRDRGGTRLDFELCDETAEFTPLSKKGHRLHPCKFLWEDLFVYWNGDVGVCCEDTAARRIIIGNINDQSLAQIWNGEKMKMLRDLHLKGQRKNHPICGRSCQYNTIWLKPHA